MVGRACEPSRAVALSPFSNLFGMGDRELISAASPTDRYRALPVPSRSANVRGCRPTRRGTEPEPLTVAEADVHQRLGTPLGQVPCCLASGQRPL